MACKARLKKAKERARKRNIKKRAKQAKILFITCPTLPEKDYFDREEDRKELKLLLNWIEEVL